MQPTIVITAYNRPNSLARLLKSLKTARYPTGTHLVISIDHSGDPTVVQLAQDFAWSAGPKTVRIMDQWLGLKAHTFSACDLGAEDGAFILLEEDLYVSPYFYEFAFAALAEYAAEPKVGVISLYSHRYNEIARRGFTPIDDGSDVFFIQSITWAHMWTASQWRGFRSWYEKVSNDKDNGTERADARNGVTVPKTVCSWPDTSWKKHFISYMVATNLYCATPRVSYVTNFADPGVHTPVHVNYFQVDLAASARRLNLPLLSKSRAIYDAWSEIVPELLTDVLEPLVKDADVCIDLYGTKPAYEQFAPYMLTTQPTREAIAHFGLKLRPRESNVICGITGNEISLAPTEAVISRRWNSVLQYHEYLFEYDHLRIRDMANVFGRKLLIRISRALGRIPLN